MKKNTFTFIYSHQSSAKALEPGSYLLDVKRAVERIAGGRVAGVCKICLREFCIPYDSAEWASFLQTMIRHPLEHEQGRVIEERSKLALEAIDSLSPESAQIMLAEIMADHLADLGAKGILVRIRHEN